MIRVVIVDDHPAVRAGLGLVLRSEPGFVPVGVASQASELDGLLESARPDVILMDYHLPEENGLVLCHRIKRNRPATRVVLYSAYASAALGIAAAIAGAEGVVNKAAPAQELFEAVRMAARGTAFLPPIGADDMARAARMLSEEDRPLIPLALARADDADIASALGIPVEGVPTRIERALGSLALPVPSSAPD